MKKTNGSKPAIRPKMTKILATLGPVSAKPAMMLDLLAATPHVCPDYATLIHPDTLEEVSHVLPKLVAVVAARVGATRLIDNRVIEDFGF